jgi:hypothetical protein
MTKHKSCINSLLYSRTILPSRPDIAAFMSSDGEKDICYRQLSATDLMGLLVSSMLITSGSLLIHSFIGSDRGRFPRIGSRCLCAWNNNRVARSDPSGNNRAHEFIYLSVEARE